MIKQRFIPGDEWLYVKIYLPVNQADNLIASFYGQFNSLRRKGLIDNWFFIRYTDPQFHIRLRLHVTDPDTNLGNVISVIRRLLNKPKFTSTIERVVFDTYIRELERYGNDNITNCEEFFGYNYMEISKFLSEPHAEDDFWKQTLCFIDSLLCVYKPTWDEKIAYCESLYKQLFVSLGLNTEDTKVLNLKFRKYRSQITECLDSNDHNTLFTANSRMNDTYTKILSSYPQCVSSLIHMHCNRLFRTNQRMCEAVAYYLLFKHYKTCKARSS